MLVLFSQMFVINFLTELNNYCNEMTLNWYYFRIQSHETERRGFVSKFRNSLFTADSKIGSFSNSRLGSTISEKSNFKLPVKNLATHLSFLNNLFDAVPYNLLEWYFKEQSTNLLEQEVPFLEWNYPRKCFPHNMNARSTFCRQSFAVR